jgi:ribosomal protein L7/L12
MAGAPAAPAAARPRAATAEGLAEVEALARAGQKIPAIKLLREQTGMGLKEAKDQVDVLAGDAGNRSGCLSAVVLLGVVSLLAALSFA